MIAIRIQQNVIIYRTLVIGALMLLMLGLFSLREVQNDLESGVRGPAAQQALPDAAAPSAKAALSH